LKIAEILQNLRLKVIRIFVKSKATTKRTKESLIK